MEPVRQPPAFQVRATQFLKKVSNIRGRVARPKTSVTELNDNGTRKQTARSVDATRKPYNDGTGPVLDLQMPTSFNSMDTDDSQSASSSISPSRNSGSTWERARSGNINSERLSGMPPVMRKTKSHGVVGRRPNTSDGLGTASYRRQPVPTVVASQPPSTSSLATDRTVRLGQSEASMTPNMSHRTVQSVSERRAPANAMPSRVIAHPANPQPSPPLPSPSPSASSIQRPSAPRLSALPQSPLTRFHLEGSVRLSPSIITRQPMPLLNLPTLPLPTPSDPSTRAQSSSSRLRSMPALPIAGSQALESADHENAALDESDEDEDGDGDGDDVEGRPSMALSEQDDVNDSRSSLGSANSSTSRSDLPAVDVSRIDLSWLSNDPVAGPSQPQPDRTPKATHVDYFTVKTPERTSGTSRTPRAEERIPLPRRTPMEGPSSASAFKRPALYTLASRSMTDVLSIKNPRPGSPAADGVISAAAKGKSRETNSPLLPASVSALAAPVRVTASEEKDKVVRRQRSMPMFNASSDPPPYPSFAPFAHPMRGDVLIAPREDEGRERLPPYTNSIYLCGVLPRKMEFTAPGVQAKDRKWRRVLCVLEGTAFKVYSCPPSVAGVGVLSHWWEKQVGVGDVSTSSATPSALKTEAKPRELVRPAKLDADMSPTPPPAPPPVGIELNGITEERRSRPRSARPRTADSQPPTPPVLRHHRSKRSLATSLLNPASHLRGSHSRSRSDIAQMRPPSDSRARPSLNLARPSPSRNGSDRSGQNATTPSSAHSVTMALPNSPPAELSPPPSSSTRSNFLQIARASPARGEIPEPDPANLIHAYTLQNAESGLGNDYLKRKNVIRVRMEGQQFLLQAPDVASVVEWIEGLHAATNIALDLDERVMPKGPMFPRRRRRRARRPDGDAAQRPSSSRQIPAA